jgi:peptide deformylase
MHQKNNYALQLGANNPILRSVAEEVETIDSEIQEFCHILQELLREHEGV